MINWKADLDSLLEETMTFARSVGVEPPSKQRPWFEPKMPLVNWRVSQREEIEQRVAAFKSHQQRLIREREEYAAAQLKRMRASRP
jgi:hypothetical protein